jgi:hypothetical protein
MEHVGFDAGVVHAPHAFNHVRGNHRTATTIRMRNEFHRYQMTWGANRMTVGVDDATLSVFERRSTTPVAVQPQFLILNIAIGATGRMGVTTPSSRCVRHRLRARLPVAVFTFTCASCFYAYARGSLQCTAILGLPFLVGLTIHVPEN